MVVVARRALFTLRLHWRRQRPIDPGSPAVLSLRRTQQQPNTCATVSTFVNLPWGYKILYGMLADCVPIFGLHRKPYMIIGWSLTWAIALFFALLESIDLQLASSLFLIMTIAYLMADCAADAALVGLSTREPMDTRGSILSTAYCIRFVFNILSAAVIAFLYNGPPTCGDFDFGLSTQQLMWVVVVVVGFLMGLTLPFYCEDKPPQPVPKLSDRLVQLHKLLQQPAVYRLILALTLTTATALITNQAQTNANKEWFHIEPLQLGLSTCFQNIMLAVGTYAYKRYLLNYSWRKTYAFGILGMQAFNLLYLLTVYFPEFKNGWWYIFTQVDMEFAYAFTFVIGIIIVPEITLPGYEGIIYGAITTFSNQAQNITNAINNLLLSIWPSNADNAALAVCKLPEDTQTTFRRSCRRYHQTAPSLSRRRRHRRRCRRHSALRRPLPTFQPARWYRHTCSTSHYYPSVSPARRSPSSSYCQAKRRT